MIVGLGGKPLGERFPLEGRAEVGRGRPVHEPLGEGEGGGRPGGETLGERSCGRRQLRAWHHAIDEADARGLRRVEDLRTEDQLLGAGEPDGALEEPRSAPVGDEADLREDLTEARTVRGYDEVAGEGEVGRAPL